MRIAIDAHMVGERETGNETYTLNLVRALLALPLEARSEVEFLLYTTHPERLLPRLDSASAAPVRCIRPELAPLRIAFGMPITAMRDRINLLHVCYVAPPVRSFPCVVTVHDISYEFYPRFFSPRDRLMLRIMVPLSLHRAAKVITISEHSRQEIVRRYRLPADRIAVTYLAASETFRPVSDPSLLARVRVHYGLKERYLLALGNLQPRKNLIWLVDAYVRLRNQGQLDGVQLVLGGKAQWRESELFARV
ncbi:MAG: glycosyltransferase family 4 protein, partial [Ardenticatenia bacterium]|nr:glycosyltransferase family 4 protein [Ardenticatenia bacterium]